MSKKKRGPGLREMLNNDHNQYYSPISSTQLWSYFKDIRNALRKRGSHTFKVKKYLRWRLKNISNISYLEKTNIHKLINSGNFNLAYQIIKGYE